MNTVSCQRIYRCMWSACVDVCVPMPINKLQCKKKYRSIASSVKTVSRFFTYVYPRMCLHAQSNKRVETMNRFHYLLYARTRIESCTLPSTPVPLDFAENNCYRRKNTIKSTRQRSVVVSLNDSLFLTNECFVHLDAHCLCS